MPTRKQQLDKLLKQGNEELVTRGDLLSIVGTIKKVLEDAKASLTDFVGKKMADNKAEMTGLVKTNLEKVNSILTSSEKRVVGVEKQISNLETKTNSDLKNIQEQLSQEINRLENGTPEEYDDEMVVASIESLHNAVIALQEREDYDDGEIKSRLEELQASVAEISSRKQVVGNTFGRTHIKDIDISSQLDGSTKTFDIGGIYNILSISLSSFPYGTLRKNIDYTFNEHTVTFTNTISASTQLSAGQQCILTVITL